MADIPSSGIVPDAGTCIDITLTPCIKQVRIEVIGWTEIMRELASYGYIGAVEQDMNQLPSVVRADRIPPSYLEHSVALRITLACLTQKM